MTDVPRRLPPTAEERLRTAAGQTHSALSGRGSVASARPVVVSGAVVPLTSGASSGGIVASGWWSDDSSNSDVTSHQFDPSDLLTSQGSIGDYAQYGDGPQGVGIELLTDGWFQVAALAQFESVPSGAWAHVQIPGGVYGDDPQFDAWAPDASGSVSLSVTSLPMYRAGGELVTVTAFCTAAATILGCQLLVVAYA